MTRRPRNLLPAVSLLLSVAVTAMWVRGGWVVDRYFSRTHHTSKAGHITDSWTFTSGRGIVSVVRIREVTDLGSAPSNNPYSGYDTHSPDQMRIVGDGVASALGFHWFRDNDVRLGPDFSARPAPALLAVLRRNRPAACPVGPPRLEPTASCRHVPLVWLRPHRQRQRRVPGVRRIAGPTTRARRARPA